MAISVQPNTLAPDFRNRSPYEVAIDPPHNGALRSALRLNDRGTTVYYRLGARGADPRWGFGFTEYVIEPDGSTISTAVSAAEVLAIAREAGLERELEKIVEAVIPETSPRIARRLRDELDQGRDYERVALPQIQTAILDCLARGLDLSALCERGGFVNCAGKADTSWLQRRAGLIPHVCRTGKKRTARTADYDVFLMLVKAVDGDPVDFGV